MEVTLLLCLNCSFWFQCLKVKCNVTDLFLILFFSKENGVLVLVSPKNPPASIVALASMVFWLRVPMQNRRVKNATEVTFWERLARTTKQVAWPAHWVSFKTWRGRRFVCPARPVRTATKLAWPFVWIVRLGDLLFFWQEQWNVPLVWKVCIKMITVRLVV